MSKRSLRSRASRVVHGHEATDPTQTMVAVLVSAQADMTRQLVSAQMAMAQQLVTSLAATQVQDRALVSALIAAHKDQMMAMLTKPTPKEEPIEAGPGIFDDFTATEGIPHSPPAWQPAPKRAASAEDHEGTYEVSQGNGGSGSDNGSGIFK